MPKVNTADTNIVHCCSQNYLSVAWWSLFTHVGAFPLLFFCFFLYFLLYLQTFYLRLLNNSYPFLSGFHENELGASFFWFFFVFHQFSSQKRVCYHFIDDVRVRVCAEAGLKDRLFFASKLLSLGARLRPRWKKMRPEKWGPGSVRKILRLAHKRFFEPCNWPL